MKKKNNLRIIKECEKKFLMKVGKKQRRKSNEKENEERRDGKNNKE